MIYSDKLSSKYILAYHLLMSKSVYANYRDDIDLHYSKLTLLMDWLGVDRHSEHSLETELTEATMYITKLMLNAFEANPFQLKRKLSLVYFLDRYLTLRDWKLLCQLIKDLQTSRTLAL